MRYLHLVIQKFTKRIQEYSTRWGSWGSNCHGSIFSIKHLMCLDISAYLYLQVPLGETTNSHHFSNFLCILIKIIIQSTVLHFYLKQRWATLKQFKKMNKQKPTKQKTYKLITHKNKQLKKLYLSSHLLYLIFWMFISFIDCLWWEVYAYAMSYLWKSDVSFQESVLFLYHVASGWQT